MNSKNHIAIATITKAHGVKGLVKIKAFTEIPENINSYGKISNANHSREFNIKIHSSHGDMLIASIEGITTKTEADKLANTKLYINREVLPDTKEEEY